MFVCALSVMLVKCAYVNVLERQLMAVVLAYNEYNFWNRQKAVCKPDMAHILYQQDKAYTVT